MRFISCGKALRLICLWTIITGRFFNEREIHGIDGNLQKEVYLTTSGRVRQLFDNFLSKKKLLLYAFYKL
jgi:hypothetical protein